MYGEGGGSGLVVDMDAQTASICSDIASLALCVDGVAREKGRSNRGRRRRRRRMIDGSIEEKGIWGVIELENDLNVRVNG